MKALSVQYRLSLAAVSLLSLKISQSWLSSPLPSCKYNTTPYINLPVASNSSILSFSTTSLSLRSMRSNSEQVTISSSVSASASSLSNKQLPTSSTSLQSYQLSRMLQASSSSLRQGRTILNLWQRGRMISYLPMRLSQSMLLMVEFMPQIVLEMARNMPETGFVTSPVIPNSVPFRIPTPPSCLWPWIGWQTRPTSPSFRLSINSFMPILRPMPKLQARVFFYLILLRINSRSKVSSLKPLPIVPIILLRLLLMPATMEAITGITPPLFLPASNSLINCEGLPKMFSPEATPTKASIVYILVMPLICFCLRGTLISIGERLMLASQISIMLSEILLSSLAWYSVISERTFLRQSLMQIGFIPKEFMWYVSYYCSITSSLQSKDYLGRYFWKTSACPIKVAMISSVRLISSVSLRSKATRSMNQPLKPSKQPSKSLSTRKGTRLHMATICSNLRCSIQRPFWQCSSMSLGWLILIRTNSLLLFCSCSTKDSDILQICRVTEFTALQMNLSRLSFGLCSTAQRPSFTLYYFSTTSLRSQFQRKTLWLRRQASSQRSSSTYSPCSTRLTSSFSERPAIILPVLPLAMTSSPRASSLSLTLSTIGQPSSFLTVSHSFHSCISQLMVLQSHTLLLSAKIWISSIFTRCEMCVKSASDRYQELSASDVCLEGEQSSSCLRCHSKAFLIFLSFSSSSSFLISSSVLPRLKPPTDASFQSMETSISPASSCLDSSLSLSSEMPSISGQCVFRAPWRFSVLLAGTGSLGCSWPLMKSRQLAFCSSVGTYLNSN